MDMLDKYEALIADLAHSLYRKTHLYDFKDLFQIGLQSAIRLEKKFDPARSQRSTFFTLCVRRDMVKFIKRHNKAFTNTILPNSISSTDETQLWESLPDLCPEDSEMVRMLAEGYSKREVARRLQLPLKEIKSRLLRVGELMCSKES
jgi:DNA-directed RNA polymerase specialized sigma24 family protein